jgi:CubicO group peptidase (beta-lactamase class C family)
MLERASSLGDRLDRLFERWNRTDTPGCCVALSRHGAIEYQRAFGMASLELQAPIAPDSVFHAASIAKQFTAMSVLLLEQRDQLSLDEPARTYLPELPDYGRPLTLRHLLTHTSGMRDVFLLYQLAAPREDDAAPANSVVRMLARQRALNFAPGADWQYNNGAYTLLGEIVKRVGGQPFAAFAAVNIFAPLGMTRTHFHDDPTRIVPGRVSGYVRGPRGLHVALRADPAGLVGNTGLFTTTGDLLRWEHNLATGEVGGAEVVAAMQAPGVRTPTGAYGFGLEIDDYRGLTVIGHGGADPGFSAYVVRYPDEELAIAVLCNIEDVDVPALAKDIADIAIGSAFPAAALPAANAGSTFASPPATPPVTLSDDQLASKAGLYRDLGGDMFGRLFVRDGQLMSAPGTGTETDPSVALIPLSADRFLVPGTSVTMEIVPAAGDRPQECHVRGVGSAAIVMQRIETGPPPLAAELRTFAGLYESTELDTTYRIIARETDLLLRIAGRLDIVLRPLIPDAFHDGIVGVLEFSRDAAGAIDGFTIHRPEVRALHVNRVMPGRSL